MNETYQGKATRRILRKQLSYLPCRFIVGCIGHSSELSPEIYPKFLHATESELGTIEDILPALDFLEPPQNYFMEMGCQPLSTVIIVLKQKGAYTDLHHLKKKSNRVEEQFLNAENRRNYNINPGAVGTYGLCLASNKPTGGRPDISTYAYGLHPHLFFDIDTYYERVARWIGDSLVLIDEISESNLFSEYTEAGRIATFEELVRSLGRRDESVELMAD